MAHHNRTTTSATTLPSTLMGSPSRSESFTSGDSSRSSLALAEDFGNLSALHRAHNIFYVLNKVRCQRCSHTGSPKLVGTCSKCKTALWDQSPGQCQLCVAPPDGAATAAAAKPAATNRCAADGTLVCDSSECSAQAEFARWPETTTGTPVRICKQCVARYSTLHDLREKLNEGYASAFSTIVRNRRIDSPIFVDTQMTGTFKNPASGTTLVPTAAAGNVGDKSIALVGKELATRARDSWHRDVKIFVLEAAAGGGLSSVSQNVAAMQSFAADALVVHITLSDLATLETPIETFQQLFSSLVRSQADGRPLLDRNDVDRIIEHQVPVMFVLDGYDEVAQLQQQNQLVRDVLKKFVDPTQRSMFRPCDIVVVTTRDEPREAVDDCCVLDAAHHVEYWRLQRWTADGIRSYCRSWFEIFVPERGKRLTARQINSAIERVVAAALSPELHAWAGLPALVGLLCDIESSVGSNKEQQQQQQQIQYSPSTLFELLLDTTWMRNRRRLQGRIVDPEINNNNSKNNPPTLSRLPRSELNPRPEADLTSSIDSQDNDLAFLMNLTLQEASTAMCAWFEEMSLAPKAPVRRINNTVNNNNNNNISNAAAVIELSKIKLDSLPRWAHIYHLLGLLKADTPLRTGQCHVKFQLDALVSWLASRHIFFIESRDQLPRFLTTHWSMPGVAEIFVFLADYARRWTQQENQPSYLKLLEQVFPPDDSSWIGGDETAFCDLAATSFSTWLQQQDAGARNHGPFVRPLLRAAMRLSDPCALLDAVVRTLPAAGRSPSLRLFVNLVAEWFAVEGFCDAIKWIEQDLNLLELLDRPTTLTLAKLHALDRSKDSIAVCECLKHLLDNKSVQASLLEAARVVSEAGVDAALSSEVGVKMALAAGRVPARNSSNCGVKDSNSDHHANDVHDALIELAAHSKFKLFCTILEAGVGPNAVDVWRTAVNAVVSRSGFVRAVLDFAVPPATMQSLPDLQNRIQQQQQQQQQQEHHTEQQQQAKNEAVVSFSEMKVLINLQIVIKVEVLDECLVKLTLARAPCQITHVKLIRNRSTVSQPTVVGGSAFDCVWEAAAESLKDLTVSTAEPKIFGRVSDSEIRNFLLGRFPSLQSLTLLDEISVFPCCLPSGDRALPLMLEQLVVLCGAPSQRGVLNLGALLQRVSQHSRVSLELRQIQLNADVTFALIDLRALVHEFRVHPSEKADVDLRQALLAYNVTFF